jgi:hypothetical protein
MFWLKKFFIIPFLDDDLANSKFSVLCPAFPELTTEGWSVTRIELSKYISVGLVPITVESVKSGSSFFGRIKLTS